MCEVLMQVAQYADSIGQLFRIRAVSRVLNKRINAVLAPFLEVQPNPRRLQSNKMLQLLILIQAKELDDAAEQKRLALLRFPEQILDVPGEETGQAAQIVQLLRNIVRWLDPIHLIEYSERYESTRLRLRPVLDRLFTCPSSSLDIYLEYSPDPPPSNYRISKLTKIIRIIGHSQCFTMMLRGIGRERDGFALVSSNRMAERFLRETEQQTFCALPNPSEVLQLVDPNSHQPLPAVVRSLRKNGENLLLRVEQTEPHCVSEMAFCLYNGRWLSNELVDGRREGPHFSAVLQIR